MSNNFLSNFLNIFKRKLKTPIIKENTFLVWEPCTLSHAEVVPGFAKYLSDLGYHVSILIEPDRIKEGLFSKFNEEDLKNISFNQMNSKEIRKFFLKGDLSKVKGVLVTTVGKICDCVHYNQCYSIFNSTIDKKRLHFVEHEIKHSVNANCWQNDIITLRKMDYQNAQSVVVNPHYFGKIADKNKNEIVNFATIGVLKPYKKNNDTIINSVLELHNKGMTNFKVTVIGKGQIKNIPKEIRKYFDIKGRLPFKQMYEEIEKADFLLTSYDDDSEKHLRYITSGTSGNFQLIYGFLKPCLIAQKFAPINNFNDSNSIIYKDSSEYVSAMKKAIDLSQEEYNDLKDSLRNTVDLIYRSSKENLKRKIDV